MKSTNRKPPNSSISSVTPLRPRGGPGSYARKRASQAGHAGDAGSTQRHDVKIYDQDGKDVTPKPLLPPPKVRPGSIVAQSGESLSGMCKSTSHLASSALDFFSALEMHTLAQFSSVNFGLSFASAGSRVSSDAPSEDDTASITSDRSIDEDVRSAGMKVGLARLSAPDLNESDLNKPVHIILAESETITFLDLPSISVSTDFGDWQCTVEMNNRYTELLDSRSSSNTLTHRTVQTYNPPTKNKDIQAILFKGVSVDVQVNEWSIFDDCAARESLEFGTAENTLEKGTSSFSKSNTDTETSSVLKESTGGSTAANLEKLLQESSSLVSSNTRDLESSQMMGTVNGSSTGSSIFGTQRFNSQLVAPKYVEKECTLDMVNQENLNESFRIMESAVLESIYGSRYFEYREFGPTLGNSMDDEIPSIQYLWSFRCEQVRDRCVMAMSWNKSNSDILAVGYGPSSPESQAGMICCWTLQNPEHPQRKFQTSSAVTCMDFSGATPNLLAVGFMDGQIAVYDVRHDDAWIDSKHVSCKHRDPIWQVMFIDQVSHQSSTESVVSISTDGRVCLWSLHKGLNGADLIMLKIVKRPKRAPNDPKTSQGRSPFISRLSGGLAFDFHPTDHSLYLVATEDGTVHKCSISYNEQYLATYYGHSGPVHRVKWSPFSPHIFASCSADWSVGLWHQNVENMGVKLISGKDAIMDIDWSPHSPTVLASVSLSGRIEVWDLSHSALDPTMVHCVLDQQLMCCLFGPDAPILVTGGNSGSVNVYKLQRLNVVRASGGGKLCNTGDDCSTGFTASFVQQQTTALESLVRIGKLHAT